jgi:hypothetical protein
MSISYIVAGRFGNNMFQYFACKVLSKVTSKNYVYSQTLNNSLVVTDNNFKDVYERKVTSENILLSGWFQTTYWINENIDYIHSLLTENNEDRINNNYTVKDIVKFITREKSIKDCLTVHIRLDDFFHQGHNSEILDPFYLKSYIENVMSENNINKCVFIVDELRKDWEIKYMDELLKISNSTKESNSLLEDFSIIYNSEYVMLCRSTFGWISSLISKRNKRVWFPEQIPLINSHQYITLFNNKAIHFNPTYYTRLA